MFDRIRGWLQPKPESPVFEVAESISGMYRYHLRARGGRMLSLCGMMVMGTHIPVSAWGVRTVHLNEWYCSECWRLAFPDQKEPKR